MLCHRLVYGTRRPETFSGRVFKLLENLFWEQDNSHPVATSTFAAPTLNDHSKLGERDIPTATYEEVAMAAKAPTGNRQSYCKFPKKSHPRFESLLRVYTAESVCYVGSNTGSFNRQDAGEQRGTER